MTGSITSLDSQSSKTPAQPINKTTAVYFQNQPVVFSISSSVPAIVSGSPRISLSVGGVLRYATFSGGSGTSNLNFVYVPEAGDYDAAGVTVNSAIDLNGGSIVDSGGLSLLASLTIAAPVTNILVDAIPHQVSFVQGALSSAVAESSGVQTLNFSITPAALGPISIPLVRSGTAIVEKDDDLSFTNIAVPAGSTVVSSSFQVLAGSPTVGDRTLQLQLGRPSIGSNITLGSADQYQILIRDEAPSIKNMAMVSVGAFHTCGVIAGTGTLMCWGTNTNGQVGDGTAIQRNTPTVIDLGTSYSMVTVGSDFGCAIVAASGALKCWGINVLGQLGDGTTSLRNTPTLIESGVSYSQVSAGNSHACGIVASTGALKCWGFNASGQLGDGTTTQRNVPTLVDSGTSYSKVAAGGNHTCGVVASTGALKCWGYNYFGQLGDGTTTNNPVPTGVDLGVAYSQIAAGGHHTCGLVASTGALKCWGNNASGQLGDGTGVDRLTPVVIDSGVLYSSIVNGSSGTCGIVAIVGTLKCWGDNSYGQLGDGTTTLRMTPTAVDFGVAYLQSSIFTQHACGILANTYALKCWGTNSYGELGDQNPTIQPLAQPIDATESYQKISVGSGSTCGILTSSGALKCWGLNNVGQIGDGTTTNRYSPTLIDPGVAYADIAVGGTFICGVTTLGALKCAGFNGSGQLGDGTTTARLTPVAIDQGVLYSQVTAGSIHACGIVASSGVVKCWGYNVNGQIGDGTTTTRMSPVVVDPGTSYSQIAAGSGHTCGIVASTRALKCWGGNNRGQLGDGTNTPSSLPVLVDAGVAYAQVATGYDISCGVVYGTGILKCWGRNFYGQIGDGTSTNRSLPTVIDSGTAYAQVKTSTGASTCGIVAGTGALKCWGQNYNGEVGDGSTNQRSLPVLSSSNAGVSFSQVATGTVTTCGIIATSGALKCWGGNSAGQLGSSPFRFGVPAYVPLK